jgi:hypothetical protein
LRRKLRAPWRFAALRYAPPRFAPPRFGVERLARSRQLHMIALEEDTTLQAL